MSKSAGRCSWDCTKSCRSTKHADLLRAAVTSRGVTDQQVAGFLFRTCRNFAQVRDCYGKTVLHIAASCGRRDLASWLVNLAGADMNAKDFESGYTPLVASLFYGHVDVAIRLTQIGSDLTGQDFEDMCPLSLLAVELYPRISLRLDVPTQVYVCGSNLNFTLGSGTDDPKKVPEVLDYFRRKDLSIKQVSMEEFHSVFLDSQGGVWVCGHGQGGRLGVGNEKSFLVPTRLPTKSECRSTAVGPHHTILLMSSSSVLACGSNKYHQLGIKSIGTGFALYPKYVDFGSLSMGTVEGVAASKYHSVFYNSSSIAVCGLNGGQLGSRRSEFFSTPTAVVLPSNISPKYQINHLTTSKGSIVFAVSNGNIHAMYNFQSKIIMTRLAKVVQISASGGRLSSDLIKDDGEDLKVIALNSKGLVFVWFETHPTIHRCIYDMRRTLFLKSVCMNSSFILLVNKYGEAFTGTLELPESKVKPHKTGEPLPHVRLAMKLIPNVHRAVSVHTDPKGKNFAIIQGHPSNSLQLDPIPETTHFIDGFHNLLLESSEDDSIHDIVFTIGSRKWAAHRYILASYWPFDLPWQDEVVPVETTHTSIFEELLEFIYTGRCRLMCEDERTKLEENLGRDPLICLSEIAASLGLTHLKKIHETNFSPEMRRFDRLLFPELSDVEIVSEDGKRTKAHKCVLAARLDYFKSMFSMGWSEANVSHINMPGTEKIVNWLLDYLYSGKVPSAQDCEDFDSIVRLLVVSDQFLVEDLKEECSNLLSFSLNLKNCASLLQLSTTCNVNRLKQSVMQYMTLNFGALLESRVLECLDDALLTEFSDYYKKYFGEKFNNRMVTPESGMSDEAVLALNNDFPDLKEYNCENKPLKTPPANTKKKVYNKKLSTSFPPTTSTYLESTYTQEPDETKSPPEESIIDSHFFPGLGESFSYRNTPKMNVIKKVVKLPSLSQQQRKALSKEFEKKLEVEPVRVEPKGWAKITPVEPVNLGSSPKKTEEIPTPILTDIVAFEQKKRSNWIKMTTKSFYLTQLEDSAMTDLIEFYNADHVFDERISIKRVEPLEIAKPTWIPSHQKL